jgi:hypothetical protein
MVALVLRGRLMNGAVVPPLSTYDIIRMAGSGYVVQYCIFDGTEQQHMCCCILSIERESAAEHLSRQALSLACVPPGDPAAFFSSTLTLPTYDRCSCAGTIRQSNTGSCTVATCADAPFAFGLFFFQRRSSPGIFSKRHSALHSCVAKNLSMPLTP